MKTGIFLAAMVQLAAAQPHRHQHAQAHMDQKRDDVTVVDTTYVTAFGPDVVVFVDSNGNPVSTSTRGQAAPTPAAPAVVANTPAAAPAAVSSAPVVAAAAASVESAVAAPVESAIAAPIAAAAAAVNSPKAKSSSAASSGPLDTGSAVTYTPYNSDGTCKSQDQVNQDLQTLKSFDLIRIYGTDCDQVSTVGSAVKANGQKLFAGIYDISDIAAQTKAINDQAGGDFSYFHTISVGNELVNNGQATPATIIQAIDWTRGNMSSYGYTGKVVTVDVFSTMIAHPELCHASDYAAVNAHSFFDSTLIPSGAGVWAKATMLAVQAACGGMDTLITESGFPSGGTCNGLMCPSSANQQTVISSLKSAFPDGGLILFTAFNDYWKQPGANSAEQTWGFLGNSPSG